MAETIWIRGESGAVMPFSLPLHPGIQDRLDKGYLLQVQGPAGVPVEQEPVDSAAPADVLPLPKRQEPKHVWEAYAEQQGMDKAVITRMTKNELVEYLRRGGDSGLTEDAEAGLIRAKAEVEALEKDYGS
jgi:hypothetical protein